MAFVSDALLLLEEGEKAFFRLAGRCGSSKKWTIFYKSDQFNLHSSPPTTTYGSKQKGPLGCVDRKGYEGKEALEK